MGHKSTASPAWSDNNGWAAKDRFATIQAVTADNRLFLIGRNSDGVETYEWNENGTNWDLLSSASPKWSDKEGWNACEYHTTIQAKEFAGPDPSSTTLYMVARNAAGIETYGLRNVKWRMGLALSINRISRLVRLERLVHTALLPYNIALASLNVRMIVWPPRISFLQYNTHLFAGSLAVLAQANLNTKTVTYRDGDRRDAILNRILNNVAESPDIVCLEEVWGTDFRNTLLNGLSSQYHSYVMEGNLVDRNDRADIFDGEIRPLLKSLPELIIGGVKVAFVDADVKTLSVLLSRSPSFPM